MMRSLLCSAVALCIVPALLNAKTPPTITTVYTFSGGSDGGDPANTLIYYKGAVYGTTRSGGTGGHGTVFKIDVQTGIEQVLYSFPGSAGGGAFPANATLLIHDDAIYGTTPMGGYWNLGTIFKLNLKTGKETLLYSFAGGTDGANPSGGVYYNNGILYGVTSAGGFSDNNYCYYGGCGTVYQFALSTNTESVIHTFQSYADSQTPVGELVAYNGLLYGVTAGLGSGCGVECGTIYTVNPETDAYQVIDQITDGDGDPASGLTLVGSVFYGTNFRGGAVQTGSVFQFDPATGAYIGLLDFGHHRFTGTYPAGRLVYAHGLLLGTTESGGANDAGTLFAINPSNNNRFPFGTFGGSLGSGPSGGLAYDGNSFWGTTQAGSNEGIPGTVYKVTLAH